MPERLIAQVMNIGDYDEVQARDEAQFIFFPLHHEGALAIAAVQLELEAAVNLVKAMLAQDLPNDFLKALFKKKTAFECITQQREARFEHDLVGCLVAVAGQLRESGNDALNPPRGFQLAYPVRIGWRLDQERRGLVQVFAAGQIAA
jgi:hypothetical protein